MRVAFKRAALIVAGTSSTPLVVSDGGDVRGRGYGYHEIDQTANGTRSHGELRLYDQKPGGSGIFGEMQTWTNAGLCFAPQYTSCQAQWYFWKTDQSGRWYDDTWSDYHVLLMTTDVNPSADYARGRVRIGEDQSFSTDPHSGWAYSAGSKY
jgi:hypothetical protein